LDYRGVGVVAIGTASVLILVEMGVWYYAQTFISTTGVSASTSGVLRFFLLESVLLILLLAGSYALYLSLKSGLASGTGSWRLGDVFYNALNSGSDVRTGLIAGVAYGVFYAVISSILVYQPAVDFAQAYGVVSPSWAAIPCCGDFGTTPIIVAYLDPRLHLGLQLVPLDLFFLVVITTLIALNSTMVSYAFRNRTARPRRSWIGGLGAAVAVFTSCPTCAGYFLGSSLGGLAAASLAAALAPYQLVFIVISIPVLLLSPLLVANSMKMALQAGWRSVG